MLLPIILYVSLFFFGSCIGSFAGALLETNISKRSFWTGRSQCLACRKNLRWYELIPVVSYILQRGKCRKCLSLIPKWVLNIELMNGLLWMFFGSLFILKGMDLWIIGSHLVILSCLLMLAIEDMRSFTIPDRLSLPMIVLVLGMI